MSKYYNKDKLVYIINIIFEIIVFTNKCKYLFMSIIILLSKITQSEHRGEHIAKANNNAKKQ